MLFFFPLPLSLQNINVFRLREHTHSFTSVFRQHYYTIYDSKYTSSRRYIRFVYTHTTATVVFPLPLSASVLNFITLPISFYYGYVLLYTKIFSSTKLYRIFNQSWHHLSRGDTRMCTITNDRIRAHVILHSLAHYLNIRHVCPNFESRNVFYNLRDNRAVTILIVG